MTISSHPVPRIFISHSHTDNEFGIKLTRDLRSILGDDNAVWYDNDGGLQAGDTWWPKIVKELTACDVFILIISPEAMASRWVRNEFDMAQSGKKRIVPLLFQACKETEIWLDLKLIHNISFLLPKTYEMAFIELLKKLGPWRLKAPSLPPGFLLEEGINSEGIVYYWRFHGVSVYWTATRGVHEMYGAIRDKWENLGREQGLLGYPTSDELLAPDDTGRFNNFQHGSIYWHPRTEAHEVHGLIQKRWISLGGVQSSLGYPVTDEMDAPDDIGRISFFQQGAIYYSSQKGTVVLKGPAQDLQEHFKIKQEFVNALEQASWSERSPKKTLILSPAEGSSIIRPSFPTPQVESPPPPVGTKPYTYRNNTEVYAVAWSPDSRYIAAAGNRSVCVWDVRTQRLTNIYDKHTDLIRAVAWSRDGARIASAGDDKTVQVWDAVSGQQVSVYDRHTHWVNAIAWSPDGSYIASASRDSTVQIWDPVSGQQVFVFSHHSDRANAVAWSPGGNRVVSGSSNKLVRVWDWDTITRTETGTEVIYREHTRDVTAVLWSPDERNIASASYDGTVQIWDALTGKHVSTYGEHHNPVLAIAFSLRGSSIASVGNRSVHVWDIRTRKLISTYDKHTDLIRAVAWARDGMHIASAGDDKTVQVWSIDQSQE